MKLQASSLCFAPSKWAAKPKDGTEERRAFISGETVRRKKEFEIPTSQVPIKMARSPPNHPIVKLTGWQMLFSHTDLSNWLFGDLVLWISGLPYINRHSWDASDKKDPSSDKQIRKFVWNRRSAGSRRKRPKYQ